MKQIGEPINVDENLDRSPAWQLSLVSSSALFYCEKNLEKMKKIPGLEFSVFAPTLLSLCWFAGTHLLVAEDKYDIKHQISADQTLNVKSQVQYKGSVIVDKAGQAENQVALPLDVRGRFEYDQRISTSSKQQPQAIRYFANAEAIIKAGKGKTTTTLEDSNRLILARMKDNSKGQHDFQIASIGGTLRQKEYELLKNPGDPLSYIDLFQQRNVAVGDKWKLEEDQIIGLVAVNRIISDSVTMMLKSVDNQIAKIYLYGNVRGEVDDTVTDLKIKGIALLDLNANLVKSLRVSIDEERRAGQFAPGFEGKVKLDVQIKPTGENINLDKIRLAKQFKGKKIKFSFLFDREDNDFQLIHDTNWRVIASEDEAAVLRYIDDGQMIAQCNVVQLPKRPVDNPLQLDSFQQEVRKIIADAEAKIVGSERVSSNSGLEILKVAVDGLESDIPFTWLYYHVTAEDGRRVTFVFTLEQDAHTYLGSADLALVKSIMFKSPRQAKAYRTSNR